MFGSRSHSKGEDVRHPGVPSNHDPGQEPGSSPRWSARRELAGIAVVIVVLVLIAGALTAVFRGQHQRPESLAASGNSIDLNAFGENSGAKLAYERGLGVRPDLTQQLDGVTVSVNWVYADSNALLAYVTIQGRRIPDFGDFAGVPAEGAQYESCPIILGLDDGTGTLLQPYDSSGYHDSATDVAMLEGYTVSRDMLTVHCLAAADISYAHPSDQIRAHILVTTSGIATPSIGRQLTFTASVPVVPGRVAEPRQPVTVAGKQITLDRVVVTPLRTTIYLDGAGWDWMASVPFITVNGWEYIDFGHANTFIRSTGQEAGFYLPYPDPTRTGVWTILIHPSPYTTGTPGPDASNSATITVNLPSVAWMQQLVSPATPPARPSTTPAGTPAASPATTPASTPHPKKPVSVPKLFDQNPGIAGPMTAGFGVWTNQTTKSGSLTLKLTWAYADAERVIAYYTITGIPPTPTPQPSAEGSQPPPPDTGQCSALLSLAPSPGQGASLGAGAGGMDAGGAFECYAERDGDFSNLGPFVKIGLALPNEGVDSVSAEVPVMAARTAEPHQTSSVNGQQVTLERVVVTPSGMRLYLSGPGKGPGQWSSMFRINGWSPTADGEESTSQGPLTGTDESYYDFYYPDAARPGPWTIQMITYDKSGKPITDPAKIATFTFDLPPASWNPSATPAATPSAIASPVLVAPAIPSLSAVPSTPSPVFMSQQAIKESPAFNEAPDVQRVIQAGMGTFTENPVKVGKAIVDVRWVYADANEIAVFYTIWNRQPPPISSPVSLPPGGSQRIACPAQLTFSGSTETVVEPWLEDGDSGNGQTQSCLLVDPVTLAPQGKSLAAVLDGNLGYVSNTDPAENFHLALNIPLAPGLVVTPHEHSSLNGQSDSLDRFAVTPTRVSLTLSGPGRGSDVMGELPDIIINGWDAAQHSWEVFGPAGNTMVYALNMPPSAYPTGRSWDIKVIASVLTQDGNPYVTDPTKIATFTVKLPRPSWLQGNTATPAP